MIVVRQLFVVALLIGLVIAGLAAAGLLVIALTKTIRGLPNDNAMTAAWIGFAGSIIGALITVLVAGFALWPAYRQVGEAQRASSVQAGQILRVRWAAAHREFNILLKNVSERELHDALAPKPETMSREIWVQDSPDQAHQVRTAIDRLEEIHADLFIVAAGVELPDLDRSEYSSAVQELKTGLNTVLDGIPRSANGQQGQPMTIAQWQAHMAETRQLLEHKWPAARASYNNKISTAQQLLRYQIIEADRRAVGPAAYKQFHEGQKQALTVSPPSNAQQTP